ncbi:MAG: zinc-binding dehydrogenase [Amaricoccus sp.]|nr:zinc-binding dehydrogenase [Amaricoccus sp.]
MSYAACGQCPSCDAGETACCWRHMEMNFSGYRYRDGQWTTPSALDWPEGAREPEPVHGAFFQQSAFATHAVALESNVVRVPADTDLALFAPLGCGFQTGAGAILNTLRPRFGAGVMVFGVGNVGLAAIAAARSDGAGRIIAVDPNAGRHTLALDFGADEALTPAEASAEALRGKLGGGADICLDTTDRPQVLRAAVDILAPRGVAGLIGGSPLGTEVPLDMTHLLFGRTVRGILQGDSRPKDFVPKLIELHRRGGFPIDKLVRTYPLAEINRAIEDMEAGRVVKPVIVMQERDA